MYKRESILNRTFGKMICTNDNRCVLRNSEVKFQSQTKKRFKNVHKNPHVSPMGLCKIHS